MNGCYRPRKPKVQETAYEEIPPKPQIGREIPQHYALDPEPVKVIQAWGLNFCLGNVVKYVARAGRKAGNSKRQDIEKAIVYLQIELESLGEEE